MSDKQKRVNYFDLKRDETMALNEYIKSPVSDKDLKSNPPVKKINMSKKKVGGVSVKKEKPSIMELPTNVPRLKKGAGMIELPDGGKYFPGGERMSEFAPDVGKRGVKLRRLKGKLLEGFDMPTKIIKPTKEQSKMPIKEFMLPKDRYQKDLKKFRKAKKESFLGLGLGMKEEHPENINKKTPYKSMDLLGKQKKKKIAI